MFYLFFIYCIDWQGFLDGVYTQLKIAKFVYYHHSHKNKEKFFQEKTKGKS